MLIMEINNVIISGKESLKLFFFRFMLKRPEPD